MNVENQKHRALSLPFIYRQENVKRSGLNIILGVRVTCNSQSPIRLKSELGVTVVGKNTLHNSDFLCLQNLAEDRPCLECCDIIDLGPPLSVGFTI